MEFEKRRAQEMAPYKFRYPELIRRVELYLGINPSIDAGNSYAARLRESLPESPDMKKIMIGLGFYIAFTVLSTIYYLQPIQTTNDNITTLRHAPIPVSLPRGFEYRRQYELWKDNQIRQSLR